MIKLRMVAWKRVEYRAIEYLSLREDESSVAVESALVSLGENAFSLNYKISCDVGYRVREVQLMLRELGKIHLNSDGRGNWFDSDDNLLPELAGCIDIDISATPFTNTLPIKRITWTPGQSETLRMVYFSIPEMTFQPDEQRYTCVDERTFHFEQVSTGFMARLTVDEDGLVLDYPGLFERVNQS